MELTMAIDTDLDNDRLNQRFRAEGLACEGRINFDPGVRGLEPASWDRHGDLDGTPGTRLVDGVWLCDDCQEQEL